MQTQRSFRSQLEELEGEINPVDSGDTDTKVEEAAEEQLESDVDVKAEDGDVSHPGQDEDTEQEEVEAWMLESDSGSEESAEKTVALNEHIKLRQSLKEKNREKDGEIEDLRRQLEELKNGGLKPQPAQSQAPVKPRPKLADFDYDEDAHGSALDEWYSENLAAKIQEQQQSSSQQEQQRRQSEKLEQSVNQHYERAEALVKANKIEPKKYQDADTRFRQALEDVSPGNGDRFAEMLIARLGEGSEKVVYNLGINGSRLNELKATFQNDPTGIEAAFYLGQKKAEISRPVQRRSQAPKPAAQVKGGGDGKVAGRSDFSRRYEKAKTDNERFRIYREAKKAGHNLHS